MTEPGIDEPPVLDDQAPLEPTPGPSPEPGSDPVPEMGPRWRRRALPALALASILVAGGLLMAVGGMARLVGPAPPTPVPSVIATPAPSSTPTKLPVTPTLGPSPSPFGRRGPGAAPV